MLITYLPMRMTSPTTSLLLLLLLSLVSIVAPQNPQVSTTTSTSLLVLVALIPLPTMLQSDIAQIFPGSSTRSKRQESGINTADFLLDFLEELPQDAATLITHPDSGDVNFSLVF